MKVKPKKKPVAKPSSAAIVNKTLKKVGKMSPAPKAKKVAKAVGKKPVAKKKVPAPVAPAKPKKAPKMTKDARAGSPKPHLMTCACGHRGYQHSRAPYETDRKCTLCNCPNFNPGQAIARPATRTANVPHRSTRTMSLDVAQKNALAALAALSAALLASVGAAPAAAEAEAPPAAAKKPKPPPSASVGAPAEAPASGVDPAALKKAAKGYAELYGREGLQEVMKKYTTGTIADIPADKLAAFLADIS